MIIVFMVQNSCAQLATRCWCCIGAPSFRRNTECALYILS